MSYTDGASLMYTCNSIYETRDNRVTTCEAANSFTWSLDTSPPMCLRSKDKVKCKDSKLAKLIPVSF